MAGKYGKWQQDMGCKMKSKEYTNQYCWYEYMESVKYALQATVVGNKVQTFLTMRVLLKYGKWQGTVASGREVRQMPA